MNLVVYLLEGTALAIATNLIAKKTFNLQKLMLVALGIAVTFLILDLFAFEIGKNARQGAGFGIGAKQVGFGQLGGQRGGYVDTRMGYASSGIGNVSGRCATQLNPGTREGFNPEPNDEAGYYGSGTVSPPTSTIDNQKEVSSTFTNLPINYNLLSQTPAYKRQFVGPLCNNRCQYVKGERGLNGDCAQETHAGTGAVCPSASTGSGVDNYLGPKHLYNYHKDDKFPVKENFASNRFYGVGDTGVPSDAFDTGHISHCDTSNQVSQSKGYTTDTSLGANYYQPNVPELNNAKKKLDPVLGDNLESVQAIRCEVPYNWDAHPKNNRIGIPKDNFGHCKGESKGLINTDYYDRTLTKQPQQNYNPNTGCYW